MWCRRASRSHLPRDRIETAQIRFESSCQSRDICNVARNAVHVEIRPQQNGSRIMRGQPGGDVAVRISDRVADDERSSPHAFEPGLLRVGEGRVG